MELSQRISSSIFDRFLKKPLNVLSRFSRKLDGVYGNSYRSLENISYTVKSVRIRSYSGPYFPAFGLNMERYSVSLRIQSECGKMRTRVSPNGDTSYAVCYIVSITDLKSMQILGNVNSIHQLYYIGLSSKVIIEGPHLNAVFAATAQRESVFRVFLVHIQSEYGKIQSRKLRIPALFMQCASEKPERTNSSPEELAKRCAGDEVAERHQSSRVVSAFR